MSAISPVTLQCDYFVGALTGNVTGNVSGSSGSCTGNAATATTCTGNAATATKLATARNINGVAFDGTANITITAVAAAGTLTGTTLAANVVSSSLTSVGTLSSLVVGGGTVTANTRIYQANNAGAVRGLLVQGSVSAGGIPFDVGYDIAGSHTSLLKVDDQGRTIAAYTIVGHGITAAQPAVTIDTSGDSFTLANNATVSIPVTSGGRLSILNTSSGIPADVLVSAGATFIVYDGGPEYSNTAGTGSRTNIYRSGGNVVIENKLGTSRNYRCFAVAF